MTLESVLTLLVAALIGGLIGGGAIASVFYGALVNRLRADLAETFASKADLNGYGTRVNALETVAIMAKDTADANSDRIIRLEEAANAERAALGRTLVRMDATLTDIDRRSQQQQNEITRTIAMLDALEKRMDRHAPHD